MRESGPKNRMLASYGDLQTCKKYIARAEKIATGCGCAEDFAIFKPKLEEFETAIREKFNERVKEALPDGLTPTETYKINMSVAVSAEFPCEAEDVAPIVNDMLVIVGDDLLEMIEKGQVNVRTRRRY